jgi:hypothetical protein
MTAIARELDQKLQTLNPQAALSLERLVRDALDLVEAQNGTGKIDALPADFFRRIAEEFGQDPFERPPQGESEKRSDW